MKKVFISCPFKGRTDEEIEFTIFKIREKMHELYPNEDLVFGDNFEEYDIPEGVRNERVYCLGKAISKMALADIVVCLRPYCNWFKGCAIENEVASIYEMNIVYIGYEQSPIKVYEVMPDLFTEYGPKIDVLMNHSKEVSNNE